MFTSNGESVFVLDGHVHFWDASPENTLNRYGEGWIECFYGYHSAQSPPGYVWSFEEFRRIPEERLLHDVFEEGYVDLAVLLPTAMKDFYRDGFNTMDQMAGLKERHPDRFILNGRWDPRDEAEGLARFEREVRDFALKGVKLYTGEWKGDSRGWKLTDPWARRYLDACAELGVLNLHVHKGPTIWPLNADAFDVRDVDEVATLYRDAGLRFIVEHCGLPRLEDFCWIASQEPNVYGGLAVAMPFINARPRYFAQIISELLYWLGEDRLLFASDYALWSPRWLIEKFMAFELPEDIKEETGQDLTLEVKRKILGLNAARLYGVEVPAAAAVASA
jgi:predicted TIM-barrel fold metal-dependent hydrolase